jgi:class 3 adenylate cyclase
MFILNLYSSLFWPSDSYLDLNLYPPDMNGPGLIKPKYLFIPFILLLLTSAIVSFHLWRKGSKYAKYLCISFALPFLSAPISGIAYLFYDFNWITWLIINSAVGILFLGMFITFGFAVAQQLNDMKLLALQQQVKLTESYQRFVPSELLKNLGKKSILDISLGDQVNVEMSILFSDIRSFTSISEKMTPKENFLFLNSYLNKMSPIIRENKGYIDKFMGDGVMALFKNSANDAVKAAVEMQEFLNLYNSNSSKNKTHQIKIGVGINTGEMMLGTLGEENRMEGSVISDAVNLASRLEGLTKNYRVGIIISEETYNKINKDLFSIRFIDLVAVKGKDKSIKIYEIFDADYEKLKLLKITTLNDFKKATRYYFEQNFEKSLKLFIKINKINPDDSVTEIFIKRCQKIIKEGYNPNLWDGINRLDYK